MISLPRHFFYWRKIYSKFYKERYLFSSDNIFNNWSTSNAAFRSCVLISLYQNTQNKIVQCTDIDKNQQKYIVRIRMKEKDERGKKVFEAAENLESVSCVLVPVIISIYFYCRTLESYSTSYGTIVHRFTILNWFPSNCRYWLQLPHMTLIIFKMKNSQWNY